MAGFDTTDIAAQTNAKPFNAIATAQSLAELNNAQNQNRFFQAKQLAGQYLARSTGQDGQIDQGKLSQFLRTDPRTGPYNAETLFSGQQIQGQGLSNIGQGITNQQTQLNLNQSQFLNAQRLAAQGATANTTTNPKDGSVNFDLKGAAGRIADGVRSGLISPEIAAQANSNLSDFTNAAIVSGAGGPASQSIGLGSQVPIPLGGSVQTVTQRPQLGGSGTVTETAGPAANLQTTLPPSAEAQIVPTINSTTHQGENTFLSSLVTPTGQAKGAPSIANLAPGEAAAEAIPKAGAAQQIAELQTAAPQAVKDEANTKLALAAADNYRSGPGSTTAANIITELSRITGININPADTSAATAQQVHTKLAQQLAVTAGRSGMGLSPTDLQTLVSQAASSDNNISNEAIHQLGALSLGGFERTKALSAAWDKTQSYYQNKGVALTPKDFLDMQTQFNATHDPRYFTEPFMTSTQKSQMYNSMSAPERARYNTGKTLHNSQLVGYGQ